MKYFFVRYKPFFVKTDPSQLDSEDNEIVPQGQLEVTCVEISRLSIPLGAQYIYCTVGVGKIFKYMVLIIKKLNFKFLNVR